MCYEPTAEMQANSKVYLDSNATTPLSTEVRALLRHLMSTDSALSWGNPSSIHWAGREAKTGLREARQAWAKALNVNSLELVFTSGASESSNTVIRGLADLAVRNALPSRYQGRDEFITTTVEHPSVAKAMNQVEKQGFRVHRIPVNRDGVLDMEAFASVLNEKTLLASVMMANNETGNIFHVGKLAKWTREKGGLFHTDAVQALGKIPVNLTALGVDYASFSAHKFYALKGTGLLFAKKGAPLENLIFGGAQERQRRGGTENLLGILGFGEMAAQISKVSEESARLRELSNLMEKRILSEIPQVKLTGGLGERLPNTSSFVIEDVDGETLLMSLDLSGFAVSTGAACSSGSPEPSPVLLSMGLSRAEAQSSLRVSLGWQNQKDEIDRFVDELKRIVAHLRHFAQNSKSLPPATPQNGEEVRAL